MRVKDIQEWGVLRKKLYVCRCRVLRQNSILPLNMIFFSFLSLHFLLLEGFFIDLHVKQKRKSQF